MFELGFCSEPDSRSLAEQYEGMCDGDEDTTTTVYYSATLYTVTDNNHSLLLFRVVST